MNTVSSVQQPSAQQTWDGVRLPVGPEGRHALGWPGVMTVIATEGALFVFLLFCYYYFDVRLGPHWRPHPPEMRLALPNTAILIASSVFVWLGEKAIKKNRVGSGGLAFAVAFILGVVFAAIQLMEWHNKPYTLSSSLYGSTYFTITGFHLAHVVVGLLTIAAVLVWTAFGYFDARRHTPLAVAAAYWHFVDVVWLAVFFTFYITPKLWW